LLLTAAGLSHTKIGMKLDMYRSAISPIRNRFRQIGMLVMKMHPLLANPGSFGTHEAGRPGS
jgi:hypothetical protein